MIINGITVTVNGELPENEIMRVIDDEISNYSANGKTLGAVTIKVDGDYLTIESHEKSPIKRVRRITGYLSNMENFNDAKQSELSERKVHSCSGCGGCY